MVSAALVYIPLSKKAISLSLMLKDGATVADALEQAGLFQRYPETQEMPIGIFGTLVPLTRIVKDGDRIEVYRPLQLDPKEKRRERSRRA